MTHYNVTEINIAFPRSHWCPAKYMRTRKSMRERGSGVNNYASPGAKEFQEPLISSGAVTPNRDEYHYAL